MVTNETDMGNVKTTIENVWYAEKLQYDELVHLTDSEYNQLWEEYLSKQGSMDLDDLDYFREWFRTRMKKLVHEATENILENWEQLIEDEDFRLVFDDTGMSTNDLQLFQQIMKIMGLWVRWSYIKYPLSPEELKALENGDVIHGNEGL